MSIMCNVYNYEYILRLICIINTCIKLFKVKLFSEINHSTKCSKKQKIFYTVPSTQDTYVTSYFYTTRQTSCSAGLNNLAMIHKQMVSINYLG